MALITLIVLGLISSLVLWWLRANRDKWTPPDDKDPIDVDSEELRE